MTKTSSHRIEELLYKVVGNQATALEIKEFFEFCCGLAKSYLLKCHEVGFRIEGYGDTFDSIAADAMVSLFGKRNGQFYHWHRYFETQGQMGSTTLKNFILPIIFKRTQQHLVWLFRSRYPRKANILLKIAQGDHVHHAYKVTRGRDRWVYLQGKEEAQVDLERLYHEQKNGHTYMTVKNMLKVAGRMPMSDLAEVLLRNQLPGFSIPHFDGEALNAEQRLDFLLVEKIYAFIDEFCLAKRSGWHVYKDYWKYASVIKDYIYCKMLGTGDTLWDCFTVNFPKVNKIEFRKKHRNPIEYINKHTKKFIKELLHDRV